MSPALCTDEGMYYDRVGMTYTNVTEYPRLTALELASREIYKNSVEGDVAEVGVYKGEFASYINRFFPNRKIHLFDTFEGFDNRDISELEEEWSGEFRKRTNFKETSISTVLNKIDKEMAIIHKGYFPETAQGLNDDIYAFVSLDTDLYKPIMAGLKFFWPRLSKGGYIFVDDYGNNELQGVNCAVLDFAKEKHVAYVRVDDGLDSTAIIQKPL